MKYFFSFVLALICALAADAQIGYQVSLINNATGEARANETVNVTVELSYEGGVLLSETKSAKTNDFGVLSLTVGDATTFQDFDWNKLPLYISATVDGILVGKSQILTVPVAQHALHTGTLTKELLCSKTWNCHRAFHGGSEEYYFTFNPDGSAHKVTDVDDYYYEYSILGNVIAVFKESGAYQGSIFVYVPEKNILVHSDGYVYK